MCREFVQMKPIRPKVRESLTWLKQDKIVGLCFTGDNSMKNISHALPPTASTDVRKGLKG